MRSARPKQAQRGLVGADAVEHRVERRSAGVERRRGEISGGVLGRAVDLLAGGKPCLHAADIVAICCSALRFVRTAADRRSFMVPPQATLPRSGLGTNLR